MKFPQEVIDEYAALGVDLPALFSAGHLGTRMGVQIVEASAERVVGTMPVEGNTQPYGLLHGGASAVLAETLGSVGVDAARRQPARSPSASTSTAPTTAACAPAWSPASPRPCTGAARRPRTRS